MIGIAIAFTSAVFMTAKDTVSKKVSGLVDGTVSTLASFLFAIPYYLVVIAIAYLFGLESFVTKPGFLVFIFFRGLSDSCGEWFKMQAMRHGDLSLVVSVLALYPLILLFTSALVTHDLVANQAILGTVFSVIGTLVILYRPSNSTEKFPKRAVMFGLLSAVFMSINTSLDRMAAQTGSPILSGFLMTLLAGLFVLPGTLRVTGWRAQLIVNSRLFSWRGLFEILFMVTKLYALQILAAPYVVGIQRVSLLFAVVSGRLIFKEQHFLQRLMGGMCVVVGIALIVTSI